MSPILNFVRMMFYGDNSLLNHSSKNHREDFGGSVSNSVFKIEVDGKILDLLSLFTKTLNPEFGLIS